MHIKRILDSIAHGISVPLSSWKGEIEGFSRRHSCSASNGEAFVSQMSVVPGKSHFE